MFGLGNTTIGLAVTRPWDNQKYWERYDWWKQLSWSRLFTSLVSRSRQESKPVSPEGLPARLDCQWEALSRGRRVNGGNTCWNMMSWSWECRVEPWWIVTFEMVQHVMISYQHSIHFVHKSSVCILYFCFNMLLCSVFIYSTVAGHCHCHDTTRYDSNVD